MSDPVGDRLRDYYRSIEAEMPERLEARAARAMTADVAPNPRRPLRLAAAALASVAILAIAASLALRGISPSPAETPIGPTASPLPTASPSASPTPYPTSSPTAEPTPAPTPTPPPTPSPTVTPTPAPTPVGSFGKTFTNPIGGRSGYTATALQDGRVLIVGGLGSGSGSPAGPLSIAQIWDPATGGFSTTGSLHAPRVQHTATLLLSGKVLIAGGGDLMDGIDNLASAELYDPQTGKFTMTGSMSHGRGFHSATLLEDGRVLIAGGYGGGTDPLASAELYDPATGRFTRTGSMSVARDRHTATFLGGKVLIAGGVGLESNGLASAELYDPSTGRFAPTGPMKVARYGHAASTFEKPTDPSTSYVLVAGGMGPDGKAQASAEVFDPLEGKFALTQPMHVGRNSPQALEATVGLVLVVGGNGGPITADFFDAGGTFRATGSLGGAGETATLFGACQVLLSAPGGRTWQVFTASSCPPAV